MRIAIDARFYGSEHTGLGRYTTNVLQFLPQYLRRDELYLLLRKKYFHALSFPANCHKVLCDLPHYSLSEQLFLPRQLRATRCQLLYTFHFNAPILSSLPTVITVHDLIKSYFRGPETTTRSPWLYQLKRAGYDFVLAHTLSHASSIIVPTNTVKNQLLTHFPTLLPEHIYPIPEAPDLVFRSSQKSDLSRLASKLNLPPRYLLYVGNAYPHKNLSVLLDALIQLPNQHLVIVAQPTTFLTRLLSGRDLSRIHLLSNLSDPELVSVYRRAEFLITPSLMEGYGLPGLEALLVGTPVIASDIPVYREVYGDSVAYFDPRSVTELVRAITAPKSPSAHPFKSARTWKDVARSIAEVIHESCARL